jgi:hypothetical protein
MEGKALGWGGHIPKIWGLGQGCSEVQLCIWERLSYHKHKANLTISLNICKSQGHKSRIFQLLFRMGWGGKLCVK